MFSLLWASLVVQTVKNLPAMQETWVRPVGRPIGWKDPLERGMATHSPILAWRILGWENPLEEGMATPSSILAWRIPMGKGGW